MASKSKVLETVVDVAGSVDPSLGGAFEQAVGFLDNINLKAVAVAGAVGGIAVATGKAVLEGGKALYNLGESFKDAENTIRVGTGATGEDLAALMDDFEAVYASIPTTMDDASLAVADYNTRLGLTGDELADLSAQAIGVSNLLGDDLATVIEESSQAFQQWGLDAEDMGDAMDFIFKVSQETGMGFTDLSSRLQQYGPQLQEMGYSMEEAAVLMGQLEKQGVNTDEVLGAMKKSVTTLAKEGISASDGMAMYVEQIQNAENAADAAAIASEVFGARAGSTMAAAIRDGSLSIEDLTASLLENEESILGAAEDTYTLTDRLQMMKQQLEVSLAPMANTIFDRIGDFMPVFQRLLEKVIPVLGDVVEAALPFVEDFLNGAVDLLDDLLPLIADLAAELLPVLMDLVSSLLPPLLELAQALIPPLMEVVSAILPPIASILSSILPMVVQIVNMILPVLMELIAAFLPIITPLLDVLLSIFENVIMPLLPPLMQIVQTLLPPLMSILDALMPLLQPIFAILGPIAEVLGIIIGLISKVVEWFMSGLSWVVNLFMGEVDTSNVDKFAAGGFSDGIGIVGEDPNYPTEAIISFNPAYRSQNLSYWAEAGRMLGVSDDVGGLSASSGTTTVVSVQDVTFAPVINAEGDMDAQALLELIKEHEPEFIDIIIKALREQQEGGYDED